MNKWYSLLIGLVLVSCGDDPTPLPYGDMRIALPAHSYVAADIDCPFSCEIPTYSHYSRREAPVDNCWGSLVFPEQRATVYLSYREIKGDLAQILEETHELTFGHQYKADNIENERILRPESRVYSTIFNLTGNTASHLQFSATDSLEHFVWGSLYFKAESNYDSLAPVIDHLSADVEHMIRTMRWKD